MIPILADEFCCECDRESETSFEYDGSEHTALEIAFIKHDPLLSF
jgi:hypothetical protein